jgi:hypothetical protein
MDERKELLARPMPTTREIDNQWRAVQREFAKFLPLRFASAHREIELRQIDDSILRESTRLQYAAESRRLAVLRKAAAVRFLPQGRGR